MYEGRCCHKLDWVSKLGSAGYAVHMTLGIRLVYRCCAVRLHKHIELSYLHGCGHDMYANVCTGEFAVGVQYHTRYYMNTAQTVFVQEVITVAVVRTCIYRPNAMMCMVTSSNLNKLVTMFRVHE